MLVVVVGWLVVVLGLVLGLFGWFVSFFGCFFVAVGVFVFFIIRMLLFSHLLQRRENVQQNVLFS